MPAGVPVPSWTTLPSPGRTPRALGGAFRVNDYDYKFKGLMTVRRAIEESRNVPAVKALRTVGAKQGLEMAEKLGITTLVTQGRRNDTGLASALGGLTQGVKPLDMAVAFATFANGGVKLQPLAVLKVVDKDGNVLEETQPRREPVLTREVAYMVTDCLKGVMTKPWGTGRAAAIGRPAAGKTGTTSDWRDAWFVGYTPQLVAAVWMGYDTQLTMEKWRVTGGTYPARIWREVMGQACQGLPAQDWEKPAGLVSVPVCSKSGKLPSPLCPEGDIAQELYRQGTEPTAACDVHVRVAICAESGKLATPYCPQVVEKVMIRRPEPYAEDPRGRVPLDASEEVPKETCPIHNPLLPPPLPSPSSPPSGGSSPTVP